MVQTTCAATSRSTLRSQVNRQEVRNTERDTACAAQQQQRIINTGHVRHGGTGARHVRGGTPVADVLRALRVR